MSIKLNSLVIHGGIDGDETTGAVNVPIYQTSTYKQDGLGEDRGWEYSRTGNPTRAALEKLVADLEGGEYGLAFASGLAAINTVLSLFKSGDRLIVSDNIYGGTFRILDNVFDNFGITYTIVNTSNLDEVEAELKGENADEIKAVYIESPADPLLTVTDIEKVSELAKVYNKTVKKVTDDYESLAFNTAISQMMIFVNAVYKNGSCPKEYAEGFIKMLSCVSPHIGEEIWNILGHNDTIAYEKWPTYDPQQLVEDNIEIVVQINGKIKAKLTIAVDSDKDAVLSKAKEEAAVSSLLDGKTIVKEIYVPNKLVNIVVK
jgi:hypothetical protein